jgi:predicted DNA-binding transcriptional regulator AlpA
MGVSAHRKQTGAAMARRPKRKDRAIMTSKLIPARQVAMRYGVSLRTIDRWRRDEKLGFPPSVMINGRNYNAEADLEEFDRRRAQAQQQHEAA